MPSGTAVNEEVIQVYMYIYIGKIYISAILPLTRPY